MQNTRFLVLDTETTGTDCKADRVVEIAITELFNGKVTELYEEIIDPERPIPPTASAIHHITDEDVVGKPKFNDVWGDILRIVNEYPDTVIVAHNAGFDRSFLPEIPNARWLCTYRLAKHIWPNAPAHKNQVLRYWLGLKVETGPAHRAMADTVITAHVLNRLIDEVSCFLDTPRLVELAASPIEIKTMPFGKHKGELISEIPSGYIYYALRTMKDIDDDLRKSLEKRVSVLENSNSIA